MKRQLVPRPRASYPRDDPHRLPGAARPAAPGFFDPFPITSDAHLAGALRLEIGASRRRRVRSPARAAPRRLLDACR